MKTKVEVLTDAGNKFVIIQSVDVGTGQVYMSVRILIDQLNHLIGSLDQLKKRLGE